MKRLKSFRVWGKSTVPTRDDYAGSAIASVPVDAARGDRGSASALEHLAQGQAQMLGGAWPEAIAAFDCALGLRHDLVDAHLGQARAYRQLGNFEEAMDAVQLALVFDERSSAAHVELGVLNRTLGHLDEAVRAYDTALLYGGEDADVLVELARIYNQRGNTALAQDAYRRAIRADSACHAARINLGLMYLHQIGDFNEAEALFRAAVASHPDLPVTHAHLGLALQAQGRFAEAAAIYEEQIARFPDFVELRWNLGIARLLQADYGMGWEDYELRFERRGGSARRNFPLPDWRPRQGCGRVLIYAEQGVGDEIMFASCVPDLIASGTPILLECDLRLASLFSRSFPQVQVHGNQRSDDHRWLARFADVACKVAIGSLPRIFRPQAAAFGRHSGYLKPDAAARDAWRSRLAGLGRGLKVGLSWRGGTTGTSSALRSISLEHVLTLVRVPGVEFVCLQHDLTSDERAAFAGAGAGIAVFPEIVGDLDRAAACIASLDRVITVDNSVAHLTGALGRTVSILLPASPDWRWLSSGERSPWYPSATLVRQHVARDWSDAIERVTMQLSAAVAAGA